MKMMYLCRPLISCKLILMTSILVLVWPAHRTMEASSQWRCQHGPAWLSTIGGPQTHNTPNKQFITPHSTIFVVIVYSQFRNMPTQTCFAWLSTMGGPKIFDTLWTLTRQMHNSILLQSDILNVLKYKNIYKEYLFEQVPTCAHLALIYGATNNPIHIYIGLSKSKSESKQNVFFMCFL